MKNILLYTLIFFPMIALATNNPVKGEGDNDTSSVEEHTVSFFDTAAIYTTDWSNNVTFSYPEAGYSPTGAISLIDSTIGYAFPIEKETTSGFGSRRYSYHKGIDIPLVVGENVVAAFGGKVRYAKWNSGGYGNLVIIRHPNGMETYYAHLSKIKVKPNQVVSAGELIGLGGSTGRSYSPHLHFETRYNHVAFDPRHIFDLENYCLKNETVNLEDLIKKGKGTKSTDATADDEVDADHDHDHDHGSETVPDANAAYYSIKSGDTLYKIARNHGTSVNALCNLNGLSETSILQIGQRVRVK